MLSPPRQLARMLPVRGVRPRPLELCECPDCASRYVQPLGWEALPSGRVSVTLRCPECLRERSGSFPAERVRELDRAVSMGRSELRTIYGRIVRDNMYRELEAFRRGLELDLIGADDFLPRRQRSRCVAYQA